MSRPALRPLSFLAFALALVSRAPAALPPKRRPFVRLLCPPDFAASASLRLCDRRRSPTSPSPQTSTQSVLSATARVLRPCPQSSLPSSFTRSICFLFLGGLCPFLPASVTFFAAHFAIARTGSRASLVAFRIHRRRRCHLSLRRGPCYPPLSVLADAWLCSFSWTCSPAFPAPLTSLAACPAIARTRSRASLVAFRIHRRPRCHLPLRRGP